MARILGSPWLNSTPLDNIYTLCDGLSQTLRETMKPQPAILNLKDLSKSSLYDIARSMHIINLKPLLRWYGQTNYHRSYEVKNTLSYIFGREQILKIFLFNTQQGNIGANILFHDPKLRESAVGNMFHICKKNKIQYPIVQYCLRNYPQLQRQVKALTTILKDIKERGNIVNYKVNNFFHCPTNEEGIAPLYSIKLDDNSQYTDYNTSYTINPYNHGFFIPDDTTHNKKCPRYCELESYIYDHLQALSYIQSQELHHEKHLLNKQEERPPPPVSTPPPPGESPPPPSLSPPMHPMAQQGYSELNIVYKSPPKPTLFSHLSPLLYPTSSSNNNNNNNNDAPDDMIDVVSIDVQLNNTEVCHDNQQPLQEENTGELQVHCEEEFPALPQDILDTFGSIWKYSPSTSALKRRAKRHIKHCLSPKPS